jgi:transposase
LTPVTDDRPPEPHAVVTDVEAEMPLPSNPQTFFLGGIFALSVFATLYLASPIILPVVLAFVLNLLLQPVVRLLQRAYLPRAIGALLTVLLAVGTLVGVVAGLSVPAANWATKLPEGIPRLEAHLVVIKNPILALQKLIQQTEEVADNPAQKGSTIAVRPDLGLSGALFTGTRAVLGGLFTTVLVLYFLLVAGDIFLRRIVEILPTFSNKRQAVDISQQIQEDISGYLDDRFLETSFDEANERGTGSMLVDSSFEKSRTRSEIMATWRQALEVVMSDEDVERLLTVSRSRTEPASRVQRAQMLLAYGENPSFFAVGRRVGVHHQTVQRCIERALAYGPLMALDDRPRPGKEPTITPEAKAWLVSLACDKAKDHGYPHELWTTRLLARHAREHGAAAGHGCLANLVQGTVCKILGQEEIKPHKVRYHLERRDAEFEQRMAEVLCVYREVQVLKKAAAKAKKKSKTSREPVAIVSYDEKPGIQAIATTSPDLPPVPGTYATFSRDHEYKRHGTLSLLAGIDLLTGKVHALVKDRHRSREFVEFLKLLNAAYPAGTAIKLILDNHSAHISRETQAWLATQPAGRFAFIFTPKHGSWLNLIEGFFSKFARSVLRHIRVASKQELKERIMLGIKDVNRHPVVHKWSYKLAEAA